MIKARKSIFVSIFCSLLFVLRVKATTTTTKQQKSSEKERERGQSNKARHNKNACGRCCVDAARGQILPTESHFQPAAAEGGGEGGRIVLAYGLELRPGLLPKNRTKWSSYFKASVRNARSVPALWPRLNKKVSQTDRVGTVFGI